jgi:DNA repair protein RadA/Sms
VGKVKRLFVCANCERPAPQWSGRCPSCGEWGTIGEHPAGRSLRAVGGGSPVAAEVLSLAPDVEERRIGTGLAAVDRVLGGGLVPGSVVLVAGAPGAGKSTLLLQLASRLARAGSPCLIASGEESRAQVAARVRRLGVDGDSLGYIPGRDLEEVVQTVVATRPAVVIVDSIQTIRDPCSDALPGGASQVRACADALVGMAKEHGIAVILVGHVTKDGDVAGPRTLEHAVDTVLSVDGDPRSGLRVVAAGKNRFGPEGEVAWFEMTGAGLVERSGGPGAGEAEGEPGSATGVVLAGRRAFAVDVQALVVRAEGPPRRHVSGLDPRRFDIVAAVVDQAARLDLGRAELYGTSSGGYRQDDPGLDLAMAVALASSASRRPIRPGSAFVGELSLTGTVRAVSGMEQRASAAAAAGATALVVARSGTLEAPASGIPVITVRHVRDAVRWALTGAEDRENAL